MDFDKILRVALYVRVSTEEQALHGYSLAAQEAALVDYANKNGYRIVGIYRDEGFSARKPATKRKKMQELLADVEAGKIDLIIFTKLDRWFRSVREYHTVQAVLDRAHVAWKTILEDYSTATADGRLKVNIMLSVAENEADRTSERIKFVFDNKAKNREYPFGLPPYGYKIERIDGLRRLIKDPETEEVVEYFWDNFYQYKSVRRAGRETNLKFGLSRSHKSWMIMSRSIYYTGRRDDVLDYCPAYIDYDKWADLQRPELRIKATRGDRFYLFTGLLYCPVCGKRLKGNFMNDRRSGKEYRFYRCPYFGLGYCVYKRAVTEIKVEKFLLAHIGDEIKQYLVNVSTKEAARKKPRKKIDVQKLNDQLRRLNNIYLVGNISDKEYTDQSNKIKEMLKKAKEEEEPAAKLEGMGKLLHFIETDFQRNYAKMTQQEKQFFWHEIISEIKLDDNRPVGIVFKDGL